MAKFVLFCLKLIATVMITLGFLFLATLAPILLTVRLVVLRLAQAKNPDVAGMMMGMSQIFALESFRATSSCNILLHFVCDGTTSLGSLTERFVEKILPSPFATLNTNPYARLRQFWTHYMGFILWQWESDFRIEKHIRLYDYTDNDLTIPNGTCSEEDLKRITAPLLAKPFVEGQSPWELLIIENYRSNLNVDGHPQCVLVLRIHHALADGLSIVKMVIRLFGGDEKSGFARAKFTPPSLLEEVGKNLLVALRGPYDLASKFVDCFDPPNCWYMVDRRRLKKYHALFSHEIPVWKIKEIMRKHNACYNAVLFTVTAGAIAKLMDEAGQEVPKKLSSFFAYPLANHPEGLVNHVYV